MGRPESPSVHGMLSDHVLVLSRGLGDVTFLLGNWWQVPCGRKTSGVSPRAFPVFLSSSRCHLVSTEKAGGEEGGGALNI